MDTRAENATDKRLVRIESDHGLDAPRLWLPQDFEPREVLPATLSRRADDARWFLHTIATKTAYSQTDEHGYVRLNSPVLRRVMSKRTQPAVVLALVDAGVIAPPAGYFVGVKSKGYRLTEDMLTQRCKLVAVQDRQLIMRLAKERERLQQEESSRWAPIHHELAERQRALSILPTADAILNRLAPEAQLCQHILVENIKRATLKFSVSNTGRCFNGLTGLKRELRKVVRLAGEPIGGVDIRCAQPALLAALIRLAGCPNVPTYMNALLDRLALLPPPVRGRSGLPGLRRALSCDARDVLLAPDFGIFESLVQTGNLYEQLVTLCRLAGMVLPDPFDEAREKLKLLFMRDLLAKKGCYPSPFEDVFQRAFPTVHRFVCWINQGDHGELIRTLQRLESWLVIENVAPRLVHRFPLVSLHDAVYARIEDLPAVAEGFMEISEELGIHLRVKTEFLPVDGFQVGRKSELALTGT